MIRARAITSSRLFTVAGLQLGASWSPIDLGNPDVRNAVVVYAGTHLQIHPADVDRLVDHGLLGDGGRVRVEVKPDADELAAQAPTDAGEGESDGEALVADDEGPGAAEAAPRRAGRRAR